MLQYKLEIDDSDIAKLKQFRQEFSQVQSKILSMVSEAVISRSVKNYLSGQALARRSGKLAQSVTYQIAGDSSYVGSNLIYARIHELGGTITPKNGRFLRFVIDGREMFTKKVVIPRRQYLEPALQDVFASGAAAKITQNVIDTEIKRRFS